MKTLTKIFLAGSGQTRPVAFKQGGLQMTFQKCYLWKKHEVKIISNLIFQNNNFKNVICEKKHEVKIIYNLVREGTLWFVGEHTHDKWEN